MQVPEVYIQLENINGVAMPVMATPGSAGYDLCSSANILLKSGEYAKVPTGVKMAMPLGVEAQIRPRSGLAAKYGITVLNTPGTIDSDYRGEICVILINHGKNDFQIEPKMRIAQLVFSQVIAVNLQRVEKLESSERGEGGFGSTGIK